MIRSCLFVCLFLLVYPEISAKKILKDYNFNEGEWVVIGVPLHNYKLLPIQTELGTFILNNTAAMKHVQKAWDLELTFEDKCDYHYALKFYQDRELVTTVRLNLHCGYLTYEDMSYTFNPEEFITFTKAGTPIDWSRISFADMKLLKTAIIKLEATDHVYWYDDVEQYKYPGFFLLGVNGLPWDSNLDSLHTSVYGLIEESTEDSDFYLQPFFHVIRGDKLYVRYHVHCNEKFALENEIENTFTGWRSHLEGRDSVRIVAIGIDKKRYQKVMSTEK